MGFGEYSILFEFLGISVSLGFGNDNFLWGLVRERERERERDLQEEIKERDKKKKKKFLRLSSYMIFFKIIYK